MIQKKTERYVIIKSELKFYFLDESFMNNVSYSLYASFF